MVWRPDEGWKRVVDFDVHLSLNFHLDDFALIRTAEHEKQLTSPM